MIESKYRTTNLSCFKDTIKYASIVTKVLENKIGNWSLTSYIFYKRISNNSRRNPYTSIYLN